MRAVDWGLMRETIVIGLALAAVLIGALMLAGKEE